MRYEFRMPSTPSAAYLCQEEIARQPIGVCAAAVGVCAAAEKAAGSCSSCVRLNCTGAETATETDQLQEIQPTHQRQKRTKWTSIVLQF